MVVKETPGAIGELNPDWFRKTGESARPGAENPCKDRVKSISLDLDRDSLVDGRVALGREIRLRLTLEPVDPDDTLKGLDTFAVLTVVQGPQYRCITKNLGEFLQEFQVDPTPIPPLIQQTGTAIYHAGARLAVYGIAYVDGREAFARATFFTRPGGEPYVIRASLWNWQDDLVIPADVLVDPPAHSIVR